MQAFPASYSTAPSGEGVKLLLTPAVLVIIRGLHWASGTGNRLTGNQTQVGYVTLQSPSWRPGGGLLLYC